MTCPLCVRGWLIIYANGRAYKLLCQACGGRGLINSSRPPSSGDSSMGGGPGPTSSAAALETGT